MTKARSKVVGESVEEYVLEAVDDLQAAVVPADWDSADEDYWFDAMPERALFASQRVPMVGICAIDPGQPVEIKSARARISDGANSRHGRFNLTRRQHERLVEEDGVYLFVIHDGGSKPELLGLLAVLAVVIEDERRPTWYSAGNRREDYYQLAASRLPIDGLGGEADG